MIGSFKSHFSYFVWGDLSAIQPRLWLACSRKFEAQRSFNEKSTTRGNLAGFKRWEAVSHWESTSVGGMPSPKYPKQLLGCPRKLGSMVSKWVITLIINGVYWGYSPLTNHLLTSWDIQVGDLFFGKNTIHGRISWAKALLTYC